MIALWLAGCNAYPLFRVSSGVGDGPPAVDLLFVLDDSDSMREESAALAEGFARFVEGLSADGEALVDFRLALTTTDAEGRAGALLGERPVLAEGEPDLPDRFVEALLCEAACFPTRSSAPADPGFTCRQPGTFDGEVSRESLDCLCGADAWLDHCGSGAEMPLEAVLDAMCRTSPDGPPEACDRVPADAIGAIDGFLRPGAALVPVVLTDEGDSSERIRTLEADPGAYQRLYARFAPPNAPLRMVWAVVGPELGANLEPRCNPVATNWGVRRLQALVEATGGLYRDVFAADCGPRPLADALSAIGALLATGGGLVSLEGRPEPDSIAVTVGGRSVPRAEVTGVDGFGLPTWTDGWEYRTEDRSVVLHGESRPAGGEVVEVYWFPEAGG